MIIVLILWSTFFNIFFVSFLFKMIKNNKNFKMFEIKKTCLLDNCDVKDFNILHIFSWRSLCKFFIHNLDGEQKCEFYSKARRDSPFFDMSKIVRGLWPIWRGFDRIGTSKRNWTGILCASIFPETNITAEIENNGILMFLYLKG